MRRKSGRGQFHGTLAGVRDDDGGPEKPAEDRTDVAELDVGGRGGGGTGPGEETEEGAGQISRGGRPVDEQTDRGAGHHRFVVAVSAQRYREADRKEFRLAAPLRDVGHGRFDRREHTQAFGHRRERGRHEAHNGRASDEPVAQLSIAGQARAERK